MTQIIVTLEANTQPSLIKKAISLLRGVAKVVVHSTPDQSAAKAQEIDGINSDIKELIGIASNIQNEDLSTDEKLAYILRK